MLIIVVGILEKYKFDDKIEFINPGMDHNMSNFVVESIKYLYLDLRYTAFDNTIDQEN